MENKRRDSETISSAILREAEDAKSLAYLEAAVKARGTEMAAKYPVIPWRKA